MPARSGFRAPRFEDVLALLEKVTGTSMSGDSITVGEDEIQMEMETIWKQRKDSFFLGIGFRLPRYPRK